MKTSKTARALAALYAGVTIEHRREGVDCGGAFDLRRNVIVITGVHAPIRQDGKIGGWINRYEIADGMIKIEAAIKDTAEARKVMALGGLIGPGPRPARPRARRARSRRRE